jgi:hypothetical protein
MKHIIIGILALLMSFMVMVHPPEVEAYDYRDCEYFILNVYSHTHYTNCLKNPYDYAHFFIYYNVTFYSDWNVLSSQSIRRGQDASAPLTPTKTGHTFQGWDTTFTNVQSNTVVNAVWIRSQQVTFLDYNGTTLKTQFLEQGQSATPPTVQPRTGYEFTGWSGSYTNVWEDTTVMATYRALEYQVTFFNLDGSVYQTYTVPYNGFITPPSAPTLEGKTFTQWDTSTSMVQSNLSIYPQYDVNQYRVRFYDGGQLMKEQMVAHGGNAIAPIMTKVGHTFAGWDQSFASVTASMDIQAQWNKQQFNVYFYLPSGEMLSHQSIAYMEDAQSPTYGSAEGYQFSAWDTDITSVTKELHVHPIETRARYNVYFMDQETILHTDLVFHGESCQSFQPVKEGHDFEGWSQDCHIVTDQMTLKANFIPHQYTVRFYDFLGAVVKQETVAHGQSATPPPTEFPNYQFTGWNESFDVVTSELSIRPLGQLRTYQAVFKNYEGTTLCTRIVSYDEVVSCPTPSKSGHRFTGWSESLTIRHDITIFAQFEPLMFQVDFYIDNVLAKSEMVRHNFDAVPPQVNLNEYDFTRWEGTYQKVTSNQRVDAIIQRKEYVVVFKVDETTVKEMTVPHGQAAIPPLTAVKQGHEFVRWIEDFSRVTTHRAIHAEFKPLDYKVTFLVEGSPYQTLLVPYLSDVTPPDVKIEGFELIGWQGTLTGITQETTIAAILRPLTYNVIFMDEGEIISEQRVTHGQAATAPYDANWDQPFTTVKSHLTIQRRLTPMVNEPLELITEEPIIGQLSLIEAAHSINQDYDRFTFEQDLRDYELLNLMIDGVLVTQDNVIRFQSTNLLRREVRWLEVYNPNQGDVSFQLRHLVTNDVLQVQPVLAPEPNQPIQQLWFMIITFFERFLR